jgi:hypothetical protein
VVSVTPCPDTSLQQKENQGEAESKADCPNSGAMDPDWADIVGEWPSLPAAIKTAILAMIQAAAR